MCVKIKVLTPIIKSYIYMVYEIPSKDPNIYRFNILGEAQTIYFKKTSHLLWAHTFKTVQIETMLNSFNLVKRSLF